MNGVLRPTKWYLPSVAGGPVPCEWSGWLNGQWIVVTLYGF